MYESKKILIIGAARSGISVAKLLSRYNNDITLSDLKPLNKEIEDELKNLGVKIVITDNQLDLLDDSYDLVIKNPAIMYSSDINRKLEELHIRVENEMEVAYHFLPKNITIIGITGSNGKTTTTTIIYEILKRMGKPVVLGGNIGYALCEVLDNVKENDILVLEISDHQLCDLHDFKTNISVLTNIVPTHLDYHGSFEHYKNTKKKIFNHHTKEDIAIVNKKDETSMEVTKDINSNIIYFNDEHNYVSNAAIVINGAPLLNKKDIKIKGEHNYNDILMALIVLSKFDLDIEIAKDFLLEFNGVEHRLEFVCNKDGVEYYNDSKSTNPTSTITALKTFNKPIHLILGGLDRNQDFNELNGYLNNVKAIYALGGVTDKIYEYALENNITCYKCYTLRKCLDEIKKNVLPDDIVLLSPGSSSQDQYATFEMRGKEFKEIVNNF